MECCSIKHLKGGNAAGHDNIKSDTKLFLISYIISDIFLKSGELVLYVLIYKKGNRKNPENYRGITLTSTLNLLNQRLDHWCENNNILSETQFAYKPGYGTTGPLFVLRMLIDMHSSGVPFFLDWYDFIENQQKQINSYIQRLGGIDIRLWQVKKERRKKIDKLTTYRI